jgi:hypothetical protein
LGVPTLSYRLHSAAFNNPCTVITSVAKQSKQQKTKTTTQQQHTVTGAVTVTWCTLQVFIYGRGICPDLVCVCVCACWESLFAVGVFSLAPDHDELSVA